MGSSKQTIGYNYFLSLHMGLGRGPLNEIAEIRVGDVTALDDPVCIGDAGQMVLIDRPELFGGETKEGGIQGPMFVYNGNLEQELLPSTATGLGVLPSIASSLGGDVPNFRGVVTCWFDGLVCSLNPYPKEWSFRVRRTTAGWFNDQPWYPAKATINLLSEDGKLIRAMNGAHILYEINTNPEWGRGMPPELLDENSYTHAANQLCDEGFGLCLPWFRQEAIKEFIPIIINHIGAAQYIDRETGKMTLRLIRGGYEADDLPLFTPDTGLLDIQDDDASAEDTAFNEIVVKGFDPTTKEEISIRVHNLASIQQQGEIISNTVEYRGIPTRELVSRVALRELKVQMPVRRMALTLDRRGWRIAVGMPFRISYPSKGIENMIVRAGEVSDGTLLDGKIQVKAVQDIFGMPSTSYVVPTPNQWLPPSFEAAPATESFLHEMNWRDFYRKTTPAERALVTDGTSHVAEIAKSPAGVQTTGYDLASKTSAEAYQVYSSGGFTAWLTLSANISATVAVLTVDPANRTRFLLEFVPGMAVMLDNEQMEFTTFSDATGIATLKRGVADTIPAAHLDGATVWLIDDEMVSDGREYQEGEIVFAKVLTRTSTDLLTLAEAIEDTITVNQRLMRPYPPGNVKVNANSIYALANPYLEPVISWSHRDRIVQADTLVGHGEGSVGPEPDTKYNIRILQADGVTLIRNVPEIDADTWTYTTAFQTADGLPTNIVVTLESTRTGLASYFRYTFALTLGV